MRKGAGKHGRTALTDPKYNDPLVERFVNTMMLNGKKSIAYKIFYDSMDIITGKKKEDGLKVWKKALENLMPNVEVRSRRVGGATFQIPQEVRPERKISQGMKWMIGYARQRKGKPMKQKLAEEIMAAVNNEGAAFKKKEDTRKMAEANKAFSHFRF